MGYTHYWTLRAGFDPNKFAAATQDIAKTISRVELPCAGPAGHPNSQPEISHTYIAFNGVNWNCTCPVDSNQICPDSRRSDSEPPNDSRDSFVVDANVPMWNLCKTNRKPYDTLVGICLLILRHHLPKHFQFASEGKWNEEWAQGARECLPPIRKTYQHLFPERDLAINPMGINPKMMKEGTKLHSQWLATQLDERLRQGLPQY